MRLSSLTLMHHPSALLWSRLITTKPQLTGA